MQRGVYQAAAECDIIAPVDDKGDFISLDKKTQRRIYEK